MGDLNKLEVWKLSLELAQNVYFLTNHGKIMKDYSLKDQMRRAAVSIPSNIAEGVESGYDSLGVRFFNIAKGSAAELKTQIILADRIGYIETRDCLSLLENIETIGRKLNKLISYRKSVINSKTNPNRLKPDA